MNERKLIAPAIILYLICMVLFWVTGSDAKEWNVFYYSIEKLFSATGFLLLAFTSHSRYVINMALYAVSLCVFMFLYFIWCMFFGHSSVLAVASLLMYSIIILYLLYKNTKQ